MMSGLPESYLGSECTVHCPSTHRRGTHSLMEGLIHATNNRYSASFDLALHAGLRDSNAGWWSVIGDS